MKNVTELKDRMPGEDSMMASAILDVAQGMAQTRGYHAFSYADIAAEVGIRKASIHYYFPGKADLARTLVRRYGLAMQARRCRIDLLADGVQEKLRAYAQTYRDVVRDGGRICLCVAFAAEMASLPAVVQVEVRRFFADNEAWLADVLEQGRASQELRFLGPTWVQAQGLLAGLQGAMVTARVQNDPLRYCAIAHQMLSALGVNIEEKEISSPQ